MQVAASRAMSYLVSSDALQRTSRTAYEMRLSDGHAVADHPAFSQIVERGLHVSTPRRKLGDWDDAQPGDAVLRAGEMMAAVDDAEKAMRELSRFLPAKLRFEEFAEELKELSNAAQAEEWKSQLEGLGLSKIWHTALDHRLVRAFRAKHLAEHRLLAIDREMAHASVKPARLTAMEADCFAIVLRSVDAVSAAALASTCKAFVDAPAVSGLVPRPVLREGVGVSFHYEWFGSSPVKVVVARQIVHVVVDFCLFRERGRRLAPGEVAPESAYARAPPAGLEADVNVSPFERDRLNESMRRRRAGFLTSHGKEVRFDPDVAKETVDTAKFFSTMEYRVSLVHADSRLPVHDDDFPEGLMFEHRFPRGSFGHGTNRCFADELLPAKIECRVPFLSVDSGHAYRLRILAVGSKNGAAKRWVLHSDAFEVTSRHGVAPPSLGGKKKRKRPVPK
jgi:hypothetical protein